MVGTVGTVHGYCTQYHTYVPMCRTYAPMSRTMRTLFTVPVVLSKPYLKKVAIRALLLKNDNIYIYINIFAFVHREKQSYETSYSWTFLLVYKPHELVRYIAINHSEMGIMSTNLAIINQLSLTTKSQFFAG